ncbi:MAG: ATP synthase F1 subunit gamma [Selenomonadaceae bacterium]|nr:ATP synthase F1 subunit gamma [Selenomonadaceae bacterium]
MIELQEQDDKKFLFLVIASDKGLAGAYSSNVFKEAHDTIEYDGTIYDPNKPIKEENFHIKNFDAVKNVKVARSTTKGQSKQFGSADRYTSAAGGARPRAGGGGGGSGASHLEVAHEYHDADYVDDIELITVGRKATSHFKQRGYNIIKHYHGISERPSYHYAKEIADLIIDRFMSGEILDVTMIYTQFKSAISCEPDDVTLLPIVTDDYTYAENLDLRESYIYEPDVVSVLNNFLPRRLATRIYGAMLHSAASELSSRMNAMSNATDNAQELIGKLNLYYNKVRQAGITSEINEIVGGAEALK